MKPPIKYITFTVVLLIIFFRPAYLMGQWSSHQVDAHTEYTIFIKAHDIGNDGDVDLFTADEEAGKVLFYENLNGVSWRRHIIDGSEVRPLGLELADLDGDEKLDLVAGYYGSDRIAWFRNSGEAPTTWIKSTIDNEFDGPAPIVAADINGDGAQDLVVKWFNSGELCWFENKLPEEWSKHIIGRNMAKYGMHSIEDVNKDGRPDIVKADANHSKVYIFENNLPDGQWTRLVIDEDLPGAHSAETADLDKDGDWDIVASSSNPSEGGPALVVYENDGNGQYWTRHALHTQLKDARKITLADMDLDGYMDILAGAQGKGIHVLYNRDRGKKWEEFVIDPFFRGPNHLLAWDMDKDGDMDVIPASREPGPLVWYENPLGSAHAVSLNAIPHFSPPHRDSFGIRVVVENPDQHPVQVFASIHGEQTGFRDTLRLYDDGMHNDNDASDHIWGNERMVSDLPEDAFKVDVTTFDSVNNDSIGFNSTVRFINYGPVEFNHYSFIPELFFPDTLPYPGAKLSMKVVLRNNSKTAIAQDLKAELSCPSISFTRSLCIFEDIPAGEERESTLTYRLSIPEETEVGTTLSIEAGISTSNLECWQDNFSMEVQEAPVSVVGISEAMVRIYPNPVRDIITVETGNQQHLVMEITSANGQVIYEDELSGDLHTLDLSAYQRGVYVIILRSEDAIRTEKIIKL